MLLFFVLCAFECTVTVSSTGAKNRFKEMTTATSGVLARFPTLLPIRNPCELRGLCRRSYFRVQYSVMRPSRAEDMWRKHNQCFRGLTTRLVKFNFFQIRKKTLNLDMIAGNLF